MLKLVFLQNMQERDLGLARELELPEALRRRMVSGECDHQDREWVTMPLSAVQGELPVSPWRLQHVSRMLRHRARTIDSAATAI
jgi:hypothetical protein